MKEHKFKIKFRALLFTDEIFSVPDRFPLPYQLSLFSKQLHCKYKLFPLRK